MKGAARIERAPRLFCARVAHLHAIWPV